MAKRHSGKCHRKPEHSLGRQRGGTHNTAPGSHGSTSYRPRDQYRPANVTDAVDRHVSRATETDDSLHRYLRLLRFGRSTALLIGLVLLVGVAIFASGIEVAVAYAGLRPKEALGVGAVGSAAFILTVVLAVTRWFRVGVDMLSRAGKTGRVEALEATDEFANQIADAEECAREPVRLPPPPGAR